MSFRKEGVRVEEKKEKRGGVGEQLRDAPAGG